MQKYKRYREQIRNTPEEDFPKKNYVNRRMTHADYSAASYAIRPEEVALLEKGQRRITRYSEYTKKEKAWLIAKSVLFVVAVGLMILLYFLWVKEG